MKTLPAATTMFPSNGEWKVMQVLFDGPLALAQIATKAKNSKTNVIQYLIGAKVKNVVKITGKTMTQGNGRERQTSIYALTKFGKHLVVAAQKRTEDAASASLKAYSKKAKTKKAKR